MILIMIRLNRGLCQMVWTRSQIKKPRPIRGSKILLLYKGEWYYANTLRLLPFSSVLYCVRPELAGPPVTEPVVVKVEP